MLWTSALAVLRNEIQHLKDADRENEQELREHVLDCVRRGERIETSVEALRTLIGVNTSSAIAAVQAVKDQTQRTVLRAAGATIVALATVDSAIFAAYLQFHHG